MSRRGGSARALRLGAFVLGLWVLPGSASALAQEAGTAERAGEIASLLELAETEYADAVEAGRIVNAAEHEETLEFTTEAGRLFDRLAADHPDRGSARLAARIDSALSLAEELGPRSEYAGLVSRATRELVQEWGAVTVPMPRERPSAARGAVLYRRHCASCHGASGDGAGPAAAGLEPPPADLVADARHEEATPARDYQVITLGIPATSMAGWSGELTPAERWDLVAYTQSLRFGSAEAAEGKTLAIGEGADGPVAGLLRRWSSAEESARLSDRELAARVQARWSSATGDTLTTPRVRAVVAYLRSLLGTPPTGVPEEDPTEIFAVRIDAADSLVAAAAAASRAGKPDAARSAALRAYMEFEAVEPDLRSRSPALVRRVEAAFGGFRGALGGPDLEASRGELHGLLDEARNEFASTADLWSLATQSFFIILREGFEAILIIGAILTFLIKTGHEERRRDIYWGVGVAIVASLLTAVLLEGVFSVAPASREVLEGITMLVAVAVLFSVSYWLLSKLEHQKWERYLRSRMTKALGAGGGLALGGVAFLAVYREGFETILFYKALVGFADGYISPVVLGFVAGCLALAVIYVLFTRFGVRVPMRPFFAATSGVLYYMAVVFAGSGIRELQEAGVVGMTGVAGVPTIDLLGLYPTLETLAAQGFLLLLLAIALWITFARGVRESEGRAVEPVERAAESPAVREG